MNKNYNKLNRRLGGIVKPFCNSRTGDCIEKTTTSTPSYSSISISVERNKRFISSQIRNETNNYNHIRNPRNIAIQTISTTSTTSTTYPNQVQCESTLSALNPLMLPKSTTGKQIQIHVSFYCIFLR